MTKLGSPSTIPSLDAISTWECSSSARHSTRLIKHSKHLAQVLPPEPNPRERELAGVKDERIIGKLLANDRIPLQPRLLVPKPGSSRRLLLLYNTEFQRDGTRILFNAICPPTLPRDFLSGRKESACVLAGLLLHAPKQLEGKRADFNLHVQSMKGSHTGMQDRNPET